VRLTRGSLRRDEVVASAEISEELASARRIHTCAACPSASNVARGDMRGYKTADFITPKQPSVRRDSLPKTLLLPKIVASNVPPESPPCVR
jgi:hypothetical protein